MPDPNAATAGASSPANVPAPAPAKVPDNKLTVLPKSLNEFNLDELAAKIITEHRAFHTAAQSVIARAIAAGEALIIAKDKVEDEKGRGHWLRWLRENCAFSERTAQYYMRAAWNKSQLEEAARVGAATIAELTMNEAMKKIGSAPKEGWKPPQLESEEHDSNDQEDSKPEVEVPLPLPVKLERDASNISDSLIERLLELRQHAKSQAEALAAWIVERLQQNELV
jgi:hypothetical protein